MEPNANAFDVLDGLIVASGSRRTIQNSKFIDGLRAYLQAFEPSTVVAWYPDSGDKTRADWTLLMVGCRGNIARRVLLWALACDFVREHTAGEDVVVESELCRRLRDIVPVSDGREI